MKSILITGNSFFSLNT